MANLIPAASSGFETAGSVGNWTAWFGCSIAQSTAEAADGSGSMRITCTGGNAGVTLNNWPGWTGPVVGTQYTISAKVRGPATTVEFNGEWRNDGGTTLGTFSFDVTTNGSSFVLGSTTSTPPPGTTRLYIDISTSSATNGQLFYVDSIMAEDAPPSGPTEADLGQVSETDTAQPVGRRHRRTLGQVSETDTAQAVTKRHQRSLGQPSEADAALSLGRRRSRVVGLPSEADTAQPVARQKRKALGVATELDSAQPITQQGEITEPVGQVSETDTAQPLGRQKRRLIGQPSESDTAQPIVRQKRITLGQAIETDSANSIAPPRTRYTYRPSVGVTYRP